MQNDTSSLFLLLCHGISKKVLSILEFGPFSLRCLCFFTISCFHFRNTPTHFEEQEHMKTQKSKSNIASKSFSGVEQPHKSCALLGKSGKFDQVRQCSKKDNFAIAGCPDFCKAPFGCGILCVPVICKRPNLLPDFSSTIFLVAQKRKRKF